MTERNAIQRAVAIGLMVTLAACQPTGSASPEPSPTIPPPSATETIVFTTTPEPTLGEPPTATPPLPTPAASVILDLPAGQALTLEWIQMVGPDQGWAIGGIPDGTRHVLRTSDGGERWTDVTPPEAAEPADSPHRGVTASVHDAQRAWIMYSGAMDFERGPIAVVVWRTSDGGATWLPSTVIEAPGGSGWFEPLSLGFLPNGFGWLMAAIDAGMMHQYIAIFTTSDGGATWRRVVDPYSEAPVQSCPKTGLAFADASTGWLTRDCSGLMDQVTVITTEDGGVTWAERPLPPPSGLPGGYSFSNLCTPHSIHLETATTGRLAVSCRQYLETPTASGETQREGPHALYLTEDGGRTWTVREYPGGTLLWLDAQRGWALGRSLHWTEDAGASWSQVHQVNWDGQFSFVDPLRGWAVARDDDQVALVRTSTGGTKWSIVKPAVGP